MIDSDLVFADLADALIALEEARGSPKEVRRAFSRFIELSQRLTAAMRKDFTRLKGKDWPASSFTGWDKVTDFFKWMRNQDQHDTQLRISVHERHLYPHPLNPGELLPVEGTWVLDDQLLNTPSGGVMQYQPLDLETGKPQPVATPVRVEFLYLIQPHSETARQRLREIGTTDMHVLASAAFEVLREYHSYFHAHLDAQ